MVKLKFIPKTDLDYVELYAEELKQKKDLFNQQRQFINNQIKASQSLFSNMFGKKNFKKNARQFLKERGIIKPLYS